MDVSIVVLTHNHPEVFSRLFDTLPLTEGVSYEVVVVDNGSEPESVEQLQRYLVIGRITTLVLEPINHFFSEGNNIGVRNSNQESKYILLLNSDVEILHPAWLARMIEWMEGIPETFLPYTWSDHPARPSAKLRDIVTIGYSYTQAVPGGAKPEGWCYLIRRKWWRGISPDFPFYYGLEEMTAKVLHEGARAGVLCQYGRYVTHFGGGSEVWKYKKQLINKRSPEEREWFSGVVPPETLDFTLGPHERRSYCEW